jgi:hypothetical protein
MAKIDYIRSADGNNRLIDNNLAIAKYLKIPVFTGAPGLNNNPDEIGPIAISDTGTFIVYQGAGIWAEPGVDMTAVNAAITTAINNLVDSAPGALDTLKELADALGDDPNFATTITNAIAAVQSQVTALSNALIPHPTYFPPNVNLTSTQTTAGLEIGQTINIPLSAFFNQNDGGAAGAISMKKAGVQIATVSPYTDSGILMSAAAVVYQANIAYSAGPVKNNILGIPDAAGQIFGGNVNSNSLSYQGFYKLFYDCVATFPTSSAAARALSNVRFSNAGNTFTLNTGSTLTKFCIVLPPGKSLVSVVDQDALNLDITAQYLSSAITVNDAAGTGVSYTLYSMSQSVPYSSSHRHNITIA